MNQRETHIAREFRGLHLSGAAEQEFEFWKARLDRGGWSFVYVLQAGKTGPIKVGRAFSVGDRMRDLQTGCPYTLHLRHLLPAVDAHLAERYFHKRLARDKTHGEWFEGALVDQFVKDFAALSVAAQQAHEDSGKPPDFRALVPNPPLRRRQRKNDMEVRFVEPDPRIDPEVAKAMRESVKGCSPGVYLGSQNARARDKISRHPAYN